MRPRLPPLKALLAFEAAARYKNFARAAGELNVTPSAISHQIHILEEFLGVKLFERGSGGVSLTHAGDVYRKRIEAGLQVVAEATAEISPIHTVNTLVVQSPTSFAAKWLRRRLGDFLSSHRGLRVRVKTSTEPPNFAAGEFDLAICYGRPSGPGVVSLPLLVEHLTVLCAPGLAREQKLRTPSDLARVTLISSSNLVTWADWLRNADVKTVEPDEGLWFDRSHIAIEAAVDGQGAILESDILTEAERAAGQLVAPFEAKAAPVSSLSYYLGFTTDKAQAPQVKMFIDWIRHMVPEANRPKNM